MLAKTKLLEIDPQESNPQQGDFVSINNFSQRWRVSTIQGATLYLRSELGNRFATVPTGRVSMIWRDPSYQPDIQWSAFYEGDYDWMGDDSGE